MRKFFSSFYFVFMIGSVFAHNLDPNIINQIRDRAATANLDWIETEVNPTLREDFQREVDAAINGSAETLKYLAFYMPKGALHNEVLFRGEDDVDPTPFIESIAVLAFVHALDNEDRYPLYDDEDSSSSAESEEAAIEILKECCPDFSERIGLIPQNTPR